MRLSPIRVTFAVLFVVFVAASSRAGRGLSAVDLWLPRI